MPIPFPFLNKIGIIVSGGSIQDTFAVNVIRTINPSVLIAVDSGLEFLYRNQISPTHIVGDFDRFSCRMKRIRDG